MNTTIVKLSFMNALPILIICVCPSTMRLPTTSLAGLLVTLRFSVVAAMDPFQLMEAREVVDMLKLFENQYPDFVKVANGQDSYGLPRAGTKQDCLYDGTLAGCLNHFFTIQDFMAHPVGSSSSAALPEMLWIGGLHSSDEELGPTVVMETASVLLEAAACEAKPRLHVRSREWDQEVTEALACRADLRAMGVEDTHRQWLARLVATRRIVVMPNANALGFSRGEHLEEGVDPAEDFPYNNDYSEGCMRTIAARTLNELFMDHMFQVVLTFQHGENKIESAWSTQPWLSPDLVTFHDFSESLSMVGGGKGKYPFGQGNADSLKVGERFQDWAYAASWENIRIRSCKPDSYGGYEHDKTERYPISSNRAVAMTISTKISDEIEGGATLGNVFDVFHGDDSSDGLAVARNMRLALVSADLLQPYISIYGVNNLAITDDVIPSLRRADNICDTSRAVTVPVSLGTVIFEWTVGGGLDINQTDLWVALAKNLPGQSACEMNLDENFDEFQQIFEKVPLWGTGPKSGTGFFSRGGPNPSPRISLSKPFSLLTGGSLASANSNSMGGMTNQDNTTTAINILGPVFRAEIDLSHFKVGDMLIVVASAKVDQGWAEPPSGYHQVGNSYIRQRTPMFENMETLIPLPTSSHFSHLWIHRAILPTPAPSLGTNMRSQRKGLLDV